MDDDKIKRKNRKYNEAALKSAIENVLESNMTLYKASQEFGIPWTTLKRNVERVKEDQVRGITQVSMPKIGRPFSLPQNKELELVQYIIKMQEIGFGLTVDRIRDIAFKLAQAEGSALFFNNEKKVAGWNWWSSFKNRYGLSLRQPENLSAGRAACSNSVVLNDFYEKLEKVFKDHDLMDSPQQIWNCDETGLMYVHKPDKIVTQIGKKYIYNRSYAEKGTTTTVLACINAAGCFIPPLVIFKGKRNYAELHEGALPNSMTRLSPKGWINADLFLEWLKFFDKNIPPARPVFLIMDSHASHITPQVLEYAKAHQIVLFTMPAHTSHVLQPLDVGVFRSLKVAWRTELEKYKRENPNLIPTRYDFHKLLTPAYEKAFSQANIRAGFKKTGIFPFNNAVIPAEVIAPSQVTDKPAPTEQLQEVLVNEDLDLVIPQAKIAANIDPLNDALELNGNATHEANELSRDKEYGVKNDTQDLLCACTITTPESETLSAQTVRKDTSCNWNTSFQNFISNTTSDVPKNSQDIDTPNQGVIQKKTGVKVTDILSLPKLIPKPSSRQKRSVPKAQCLTPIDLKEQIKLIPKKDNSKQEKVTASVVASTSKLLDQKKGTKRSNNYEGKSDSKNGRKSSNKGELNAEKTPIAPKEPIKFIPNKDNEKVTASVVESTSKVLDQKKGTKRSNNYKGKSDPKKGRKSSNKGESNAEKTKIKQKTKEKTEDDWKCHSCSGLYSQDVLSKNGADWIVCSFCMKPYHLHCQSQEIDKNQKIFMCDACSVDNSSN